MGIIGQIPWNKGKHTGNYGNGFKKGLAPWNKNKKTGLIPKSAFKKGHIAPKTAFKKGIITWNKGIEYLAIKGDKNPRWKGGITPIYKAIRASFDYEEWRKKVFERDSYTCQSCMEVGGYLHAHHILNFSSYKDIRLDIDNGATLCRECHYNFHTQFGFTENTREQLSSFLAVSAES